MPARAPPAARRGTPLSDADEPAADPVDPTGPSIHADQLRELVRSAAQGLSDGDREMIELAVRHELGAAEVGSVLGVSTDHAHARMSRARAQLHRSLGALLVARAGGARCATLTELTRGWDGVFTPLLRKRVSRHIERCARCSERQQELLNPAQLLPAYAALPFLPVLVLIWPRIAPDPARRPTRVRAPPRGPVRVATASTIHKPQQSQPSTSSQPGTASPVVCRSSRAAYPARPLPYCRPAPRPRPPPLSPHAPAGPRTTSSGTTPAVVAAPVLAVAATLVPPPLLGGGVGVVLVAHRRLPDPDRPASRPRPPGTDPPTPAPTVAPPHRRRPRARADPTAAANVDGAPPGR